MHTPRLSYPTVTGCETNWVVSSTHCRDQHSPAKDTCGSLAHIAASTCCDHSPRNGLVGLHHFVIGHLRADSHRGCDHQTPSRPLVSCGGQLLLQHLLLS
ncbi:hypothetical protein F2Q68_00027605 [Brassica cretica]|uniref:Uncharacterized protein n=1 Tax=Brassica cretica TaxID=69181 RepID=A0A8S9I7N1_BRACR|nr:hypothetical protein F2Q68_00027605 [Brassica cretica]